MNKKFLKSVACLSLCMVCAFGFAGCGDDPQDPHKHDYTQVEYTIENGNAYKVTTCGCEETKKQKVANAVIATPATAQEILDSNIDNKTVVFAPGTYGTLMVRSTRDSVDKIYSYDVANPKTLEAEKTLEEVKDTTTGSYHYVRNLENVNFVSVDGAEFIGVFSIQSKMYNLYNYFDDIQIGLDDTVLDDFDVIRNRAVENQSRTVEIDEYSVAYADHININNITFENMDFNGDKGRIFVGNIYNDTKMENITIKNCSFVTGEEFETVTTISAIQFDHNGYTDLTEYDVKNVTIENCTIDGHFQGIRISNANNVTIKNNTIKNSTHNLINMQGFGGTDGTILIENNTLENAADRAIRFAQLNNSTVTIKNNALVNAAKSNGEILKTETSAAGSSIAMQGNTFDGAAIANGTYTTEQSAVITISR